MTEWDKLKERMVDYIKSMDDTPTEEQTTIYDLMVGGLIGEGNKLQAKNKGLEEAVAFVQRTVRAQVEIITSKDEKLEAIRGIIGDPLDFDDPYTGEAKNCIKILELLGE